MARPKARKADPRVAVGYARVSTARQATDGISLEYQQDAIAQYCRLHDLQLSYIVVDAGHSAYKQPLRRRAEGSQVIALASKREVGAVVTLRLDRLFRSIRDCIVTVMDWDKAGVSLHLIDLGGQSIDTSGPMGRMLITMIASVAELESYHKAERARDAWDHHRSRGKRLGSKPPYGYTMGEDGGLVEREDEQKAIKKIHRLRRRGLSVAKIAKNLDKRGPSPRGARWHAKTINRILERESP